MLLQSIPTVLLGWENSWLRVSITQHVPWALLEPDEPYLPRAAINPSSLRSTGGEADRAQVLEAL